MIYKLIFEDQSEDFKDQLLDYVSDNLNDINELDSYIDKRVEDITVNVEDVEDINSYF